MEAAIGAAQGMQPCRMGWFGVVSFRICWASNLQAVLSLSRCDRGRKLIEGEELEPQKSRQGRRGCKASDAGVRLWFLSRVSPIIVNASRCLPRPKRIWLAFGVLCFGLLSVNWFPIYMVGWAFWEQLGWGILTDFWTLTDCWTGF